MFALSGWLCVCTVAVFLVQCHMTTQCGTLGDNKQSYYLQRHILGGHI